MSMRSLLSTSIGAAVALSAVLWQPAPVFASAVVMTSSTGDGVFQVTGTGIEGASAIELAVSYDTASLANPRLVNGPLISGAMTAFNPNVPGIARMVIVRLTPVKGSGVIGTLTFDRTGPSPGKILSLSAKLADIKGSYLPAAVQVNNSSEERATAPVVPQNATIAAKAGETHAAIGPIVSDEKPEKQGEGKAEPDPEAATETGDQPAKPEPLPAPQAEPAVLARTAVSNDDAGSDQTDVKTAAQKLFAQKSILDRFQEYRGRRTPEAFVSLFEQDRIYWWRQEPPVALSDGKTTVRMTFISTPGNKTPSEIEVLGARFVSLKKDPDNSNTWIVELVPKKGGYQASFAVVQGGIKMIYPLTIAPNIGTNRSRTETITKAEFSRYVARQKAARSAGLDANKDGKLDYIDDYIITANYLASAKRGQDNISSRTGKGVTTNTAAKPLAMMKKASNARQDGSQSTSNTK